MIRHPAALFLAVLLPAAAAQTADRRAETVRYLQSLQQPDGGFAGAEDALGKPSDLRGTASAGRALKYLGAAPADPEAAARFVLSCHSPDAGGFAPRPGGTADATTTAVGVMIAVDLKIPPEKFARAADYLTANARTFEEVRLAAGAFESLGTRPPAAAAWAERAAADRNPDGTFGTGPGQARDTGGAVALLLRLGMPVERDAVLKTLRAGQRADGGFGKADADGSDLETTYRVMRAFRMLKESPADPAKLAAFVDRCRNADGGYGVAPGKPSSAGGAYYAAVVGRWLAEGR